MLADRFTSEQGKRFFALISVGGTLGAIVGPWLTSQLALPLVGAQTEGALGRLGLAVGGLISVVVPLALVWAALGLWLGRVQAARALPLTAGPDGGNIRLDKPIEKSMSSSLPEPRPGVAEAQAKPWP